MFLVVPCPSQSFIEPAGKARPATTTVCSTTRKHFSSGSGAECLRKYSGDRSKKANAVQMAALRSSLSVVGIMHDFWNCAQKREATTGIWPTCTRLGVERQAQIRRFFLLPRAFRPPSGG